MGVDEQPQTEARGAEVPAHAATSHARGRGGRVQRGRGGERRGESASVRGHRDGSSARGRGRGADRGHEHHHAPPHQPHSAHHGEPHHHTRVPAPAAEDSASSAAEEPSVPATPAASGSRSSGRSIDPFRVLSWNILSHVHTTYNYMEHQVAAFNIF